MKMMAKGKMMAKKKMGGMMGGKANPDAKGDKMLIMAMMKKPGGMRKKMGAKSKMSKM